MTLLTLHYNYNYYINHLSGPGFSAYAKKRCFIDETLSIPSPAEKRTHSRVRGESHGGDRSGLRVTIEGALQSYHLLR